MINLKNLKSLFVVEEESGTASGSGTETKKSTPAQEPISPAINGPINAPISSDTPAPVSEPTPPPPPPKAKINPRVYEKLMEAIERNNQDGFDYLEFKSSLKALAGLHADEATRFKTSYATASTMGVTVDKLLNSAAYYLQVMDKEKEAFKGVLKGLVEREILGRDQQREALKADIQSMQAQIKALNEKISAQQEKLGGIDEEVAKAQVKIEGTKSAFLATYNHIVDNMNSDVDKIQRYLG